MKTLPDRIEGETNWQWCQRAAASYTAEELVVELLKHLKREAESENLPLRYVVGQVLRRGSGVVQAIIERFLPEEADENYQLLPPSLSHVLVQHLPGCR